MRLSLIIPCYNESANLGLLLGRCAELTKTDGVAVILVDNGSTDETPRVLNELLPGYPGCRSIRVENNQGYGFGILSGLRAADTKLLGWTHADMQTDPVDARRGLELFVRHGAGIFVKGRRYGRSFGDAFFTGGMSVFETMLLGRVMHDINAQPTLFSRTFFEGWQEPPHDFSLDLYAYYQARSRNIPVHRFPVHFGKRAHGVSSWNINWQAKWKFIRRTVDFSLKLRKSIHR